jgi:hypothetical protein
MKHAEIAAWSLERWESEENVDIHFLQTPLQSN